MFERRLTRAGRTRRFEIRAAGELGWDVREEQDNRVVRQVRYDDWHRVERALTRFSARVSSLLQQGWVDQ